MDQASSLSVFYFYFLICLKNKFRDIMGPNEASLGRNRVIEFCNMYIVRVIVNFVPLPGLVT